MSEAIGQPGAAALPRPMGIGEILRTAFQLYQRHWRTLLAIAAVVVVPLTLLQYLFGDLVRTQGETTRNGVVETATWSVGIAGLLAALAGILMYLVLTGAITRAVAAEVAGEDPSVEQSYRFGFHRLSGFPEVLSVTVEQSGPTPLGAGFKGRLSGERFPVRHSPRSYGRPVTPSGWTRDWSRTPGGAPG
jgi:hypothetical protein